MFTYSQYWKNNNIEKYFEKYAQKWRLGNVSVDVNKEHFLEGFGTFLQVL